MKFLLVCFMALAASVSAKMVDDAKIKECAANNKITDLSLVQKMMAPGFTTTSKDEKCFGLCVGMASGCLSADGTLMPGHEADAPEGIDKAKIAAAAAECVKMTDADPCEQAYKQWTCLMDKAKKM
ncbi:uncharacterized protein LOC134828725 [Culicoides brevitarsis]|uniref:uncharacterized protein LOC134828725 n=1 Tax=Culicoides brevitarsis TaxID=469753 RepID=UPI00307C4F90